MDDTILAILAGGVPESEFFATYWRRRFLFRTGAGRSLLAVMPSPEDVAALLGTDAREEHQVARFVSFPPSGRPVTRSWVAAPGRFPGGSTRPSERDEGDESHLDEAVNVPGAERWWPALAPFASALSRRFSAAVNLQLFLAPPGRGLNPHRDLHDSFVVQIAGRKRWTAADVAPDAPLAGGNSGGTLPPDATTFDLAPGDVLYKPSNAVHATASSDEPTLSLTASIVTRTARDVLLEWLGAALPADQEWLERFPLLADDPATPAARARLERASEALAIRLPSVGDLERRARP